MKRSRKKDPFDTNKFHIIWGIVAIVLIIAIAFYIYAPRRTLPDAMRTPTPPPLSSFSTPGSADDASGN